MSLPLAETLKIILASPRRPPPRGTAPGCRGRLGELFRNLQADPPGPAAHAIEDDIWAIWIAHDDPHLENRMRSEEHTSELQSLMRNSYAVFRLKKNTTTTHQTPYSPDTELKYLR